jgi:hypothetical protein
MIIFIFKVYWFSPKLKRILNINFSMGIATPFSTARNDGGIGLYYTPSTCHLYDVIVRQEIACPELFVTLPS